MKTKKLDKEIKKAAAKQAPSKGEIMKAEVLANVPGVGEMPVTVYHAQYEGSSATYKNRKDARAALVIWRKEARDAKKVSPVQKLNKKLALALAKLQTAANVQGIHAGARDSILEICEAVKSLMVSE